MTLLKNTFIFLFLTIIYFCNNSANDTADASINDTISIEPNIIQETTSEVLPGEEDTITDIQFPELALSINRLLIYDEDKEMEEIQTDTVTISPELGEGIEGQTISISTDKLINLKVEQRFETSVTIMNEGPHCDLTDWEHFYSDWKKLSANNKGQFICDRYTEKDWEKFPKISVEELKKKIKEQCGEEWVEIAKNIKSPTEYPSGVSISRYFIRVSGQLKDNGKTVTKLIIIENPMGC